MYAIRSYYEQYALQESELGASGGVQLVNLDFSETSRSSTTASIVDDNGDTIQIEQIDEVVITSYSIHYTKLYDRNQIFE